MARQTRVSIPVGANGLFYPVDGGLRIPTLSSPTSAFYCELRNGPAPCCHLLFLFPSARSDAIGPPVLAPPVVVSAYFQSTSRKILKRNYLRWFCFGRRHWNRDICDFSECLSLKFQIGAELLERQLDLSS